MADPDDESLTLETTLVRAHTATHPPLCEPSNTLFRMHQIPVPFVTSHVNFLRIGRLCADIHKISPLPGRYFYVRPRYWWLDPGNNWFSQGGNPADPWRWVAWAWLGIRVDTPTTPGSAEEVPTARTVGAEVGPAKLRAVFRHITGSFLTETRAFVSRV
jgi:hypothetical protein